MRSDELDKMHSIKIDRWLDVNSSEWKELDDDYQFTKKIIKIGFEGSPTYFIVDELGRIFGRHQDQTSYHPLHIETKSGKLIGAKLSSKAAN